MKIERHFGPRILQTQASPELVNNLNSWVDEMQPAEHEVVSSKGDNPIPDLLDRGFETLFLPYEVCDETGFTAYVMSLAEEYGKSAVIPPAIFDGRYCKQYADVWVNRYYQGHKTPPHNHAYNLSGIIMLKVPAQSPTLEFFLAGDTYTPSQYTGATLLFPNYLEHQVYTQETDEERRTLSFNLYCK